MVYNLFFINITGENLDTREFTCGQFKNAFMVRVIKCQSVY